MSEVKLRRRREAAGILVVSQTQAQHEYRALIHRRVRQLSDALDTYGLFDKRRKLRVAWLPRLEALMTLATRIDSTLGLERRSKAVPSPLDYINGRWNSRRKRLRRLLWLSRLHVFIAPVEQGTAGGRNKQQRQEQAGDTSCSG